MAFHNAGTVTSDAADGSSVSISVPFINTGSVVLQQGSLSLGGDEVTPSTGSFSAAAGTTLSLSEQVLTPASVIASAGAVSLAFTAEAGSYSAAGSTSAYGTSFTGSVLDLGSSLEVGATVSFAPTAGGPVTLTTGAVSIDYASDLTGTDSFVAEGLLTVGSNAQLSVSGSVDAYGGLDLSGGNVVIRGTTLNNHAAATWDLVGDYDLLEAGAVINNLAGASFAVTASGIGGSIQAGDGTAVAFNNAGTFTYDATDGNSATISVPFVNTGSVDVQQGSLDLTNLSGTRFGYRGPRGLVQWCRLRAEFGHHCFRRQHLLKLSGRDHQQQPDRRGRDTRRDRRHSPSTVSSPLGPAARSRVSAP